MREVSVGTRSSAYVYIPGPGPLPPVDEVGGKAHHLARLASLAGEHGFTVPEFAVLRVSAFGAFTPARKAAADSAATWADQVRSLACPEEIRDALSGALAALPEDALLAVRSSAVAEDAAGKSFAGQFATVLGVRATAGEWMPLWEAVRRVWASAAGAHALAYAGAGSAAGTGMAVVIQAMADSVVAGVAFTSDPVKSLPDTTLVSAVHGLGEGLVSGELDADTWWVSIRDGVPGAIEAVIAHKDRALRLDPSGATRMEPVPEAERDVPALSEAELRTLVVCANAIAAASDGPQDIEWALAGRERRLVILQSRPITALATSVRSAGPPGERHVWDNSNIIESYGGVTTPLTFSFARSVYEDVYRQFCRLMGTPEPLLASHAPVFANMLGLVRGRVYYDLLNWYRTLALLPGFTWNREFMEKMMGVRESLTDAPPVPGSGSRTHDFVNLVRMLLRLVRESGRLRVEVPAFHARLERVLGPLAGEDLECWPSERALALYHRLEDELLRHWRTPLVNDFFAMIWFGVLGRLTERWLPGAAPTLVNDLLCGEGGIVSTEPARRIMTMARQVSADPALSTLLERHADDRAFLAELGAARGHMPGAAALDDELKAYLERFGDRCMEELKLETITLREDPSFLVHTLRAYVAGGTLDPEAAWERERAIRLAAEVQVDARLGWARRSVYRGVLKRARARVRDRENLRFERTRVFGVVRRIFLALGSALARTGRLAETRDVFLLTREELFGALGATGASTDLASLVSARREEFAGYAGETPPPDRFESVGPPSARDWAGATAAPRVPAGAELVGTGCCPGVVRACVRLVRDPREAQGLAGHILAAERTDPGWTVLFPTVAGLLVQRGSLLSHSAIVAREMGIPCVVGVAGLMASVNDGEEVEMDGTTGRVRRLERPA